MSSPGRLAEAPLSQADLLPKERIVLPLAIAGTGYGIIGILVIILLIILIFYFLRRA